jgi:hypothetical protein
MLLPPIRFRLPECLPAGTIESLLQERGFIRVLYIIGHAGEGRIYRGALALGKQAAEGHGEQVVAGPGRALGHCLVGCAQQVSR